MALLRVYVEADFEVPDDPKERYHLYETVDLEECGRLEQQNQAVSVLSLNDVTYRRYEIKPVPEGS